MSSEVIEKYRLLVRHSDEQLSDQVNEYIQNGWEPYGSPNISAWHDSDSIEGYGQNFIQAMVKRTKE